MYSFQNESITEKCVKWEEIDGVTSGVLTKVCLDEYQFFLTCTTGNSSSEIYEIMLIRDIRISSNAKIPKDRKVLDLCTALNDESDDLTERCISICSGTDFVNLTWLHLVSKSKQFATKLNDIIICQMRHSRARNPNHINHIQKIWNRIYLENSDSIDIVVLTKYFSQNKEDREKIQEVFTNKGYKSQNLKKQDFTFDLFLEIYETLFLQELFGNIYNQIASIEAHSMKQINNVEFAKFLNQFQRDKRLNEILYPLISNEKAKEIISKYEPNADLSKQGLISSFGLAKYLFSEENFILDQSNFELSQDMNQPLNHYFINSSHNTYLSGHQLTGKSSAEIYRQVLLSGCRCIELDIWDGKGMDDEPIVTHGFTMCTAVSLRDVIDAIDESAFKISEYPVILSFENHCTSKQLPLLVSIVQEKLSNKILHEPLDTNQLEPGVPLPSPDKLKGKILIKNKKKVTTKDSDIATEENDQEEEEKSAEIIIPQISSMVNYVEPTSFESFEKAKIKNVSFECCSFGEVFAIQSLNENPVDFVNFNKRQISRIYPKGTRVDSSNFLPQLFWNAGCQLVALNYQTLDLGMQLNLGLFELQNRCGYLLKPLEMRSSDRDFDPFLESGLDGVVSNTLKITVLSGHFISDKAVYCFVELEMFGLPADTVRKRHKIKSTTKTGLNPQFSKTEVSFKKIIHPKLAILRILVTTENSKFVGQSWLNVDQIKPGYRFLSLKNESAQTLMMPSLLIFIEIEDYVPCDMEDFALALSNPIAFLSEKERRAHQLEIFTEDFTEKNTDEENITIEVNQKSKVNSVKSDCPESVSKKVSPHEVKTETLFSKKKQQTMKLKQSFKKKSSLKRGKSTRGTLDNEEIYEFLNQSILRENALSDINLDKMKSYKGCLKIIEKKESLIAAVRKKYNKKGNTKDENTKDLKSNKKSIKYKTKSNSTGFDESFSEDVDYQTDDELQRINQVEAKNLGELSNLSKEEINEINLINTKYTNILYDELNTALESDVIRFKQRIEKIYRKESEVLKSLQHYKFKCESKFLQRESSNKEEFNRLKREALQKHVQTSVAELEKLTDLKNNRLKELDENNSMVSEKLKIAKNEELKVFN